MTGEAGNGTRIANARLDWDAGAPRSVFFDDIYYAPDSLAETEHIFLAGNGLAERFAAAPRFSIGELGFGTGLNFLAAWSLWDACKPAGARLYYFAVEGFPLHADDMARAHAAFPGLEDRAARLRAIAPTPTRGFHSLALAEDATLVLAYGEAQTMLAEAEAIIDAWFFDGFAPAKNPQMWRAEVFDEVARLSAPGATFSTFTVAGAVRRNLEAAGLSWEKCEGFGRKKEMLAGRIEAPPRASKRAPWFQNAGLAPLAPGARIGIVGGGVAGAALAFEAARAGLAPTIIEAESLGAGASGNPAGIVMPRLDLGGGPAARFFAQTYLHAIRLLSDSRFAGAFNPCGALLVAKDEAEKERQRKILAAGLLPEGWTEARPEGLFFPQAGVVDPPRLVAALAGETEIVRARARAIRREGETMRLFFDDGDARAFDAIVLANGADALRFAPARSLPLAPVAGQIDLFENAAAPAHVVAGGAYAAPAPGGGLVIGATHEKNAHANVSREATAANIEKLAALAADLAAGLDPDAARPRAAVRCATPDRLPACGPLPDLGQYAAAFDDLRTGARRDYPPGEILPGVFILAGLGGRGLVSTPLAAAMLIAELTDAPAPVDYKIAEALHPARFYIRDLKRARRVRPS